MDEDEPSPHLVTLPHSGNNSTRVSASSGESLTYLARRFFALWSTSSRPRLHLSISEPDQPSVPIISEPSLQHDRTLSQSGATHTTSAETSPISLPTSLASPSLSDPSAHPASLGFGALAEAEAGVSRHLTSQEEISDLAANAERLRLTTSTPISTLDIRQIARSVETSLPFLLLVLLVFTYHHFKSIVLLTMGTSLLHSCNTAIQQQIARRGDVERKKSMRIGLVQICFALVMPRVAYTSGRKLERILIFRSSALDYQFWSLLFTIALADILIRLIMAAFKAWIVAWVRADTQVRCRRRGSLISSLDYCIAVYRSMLPAPLWLKYFQNSNLPFLLSMGLSGFYLVAKAANVLEKVSLARMALAQVRGGSHGTVPTAEELAAAPRECAICQDDVRNPLKLVCGHIYCEDCVEEWLARESSCPMCRREVRRATLKPKNDGATSLLPILC